MGTIKVGGSIGNECCSLPLLFSSEQTFQMQCVVLMSMRHASETMEVRSQIDTEDELPPVRKANRERREQADLARPIVHGALPFHGHRPDAKAERRRRAEAERAARKRA